MRIATIGEPKFALAVKGMFLRASKPGVVVYTNQVEQALTLRKEQLPKVTTEHAGHIVVLKPRTSLRILAKQRKSDH